MGRRGAAYRRRRHHYRPVAHASLPFLRGSSAPTPCLDGPRGGRALADDRGDGLYTDVEVTRPSNDKGVDVKARIELGITAVNEVVQAKRTRSNVQRPVLDQLRGSLHRFGAVRGTIITTAGFAKGATAAAFEAGAAPITLIDGEKLVDLLIENDIGARRTNFRATHPRPERL